MDNITSKPSDSAAKNTSLDYLSIVSPLGSAAKYAYEHPQAVSDAAKAALGLGAASAIGAVESLKAGITAGAAAEAAATKALGNPVVKGAQTAAKAMIIGGAAAAAVEGVKAAAKTIQEHSVEETAGKTLRGVGTVIGGAAGMLFDQAKHALDSNKNTQKAGEAVDAVRNMLLMPPLETLPLKNIPKIGTPDKNGRKSLTNTIDISDIFKGAGNAGKSEIEKQQHDRLLNNTRPTEKPAKAKDN